jgi:hypothetical protein
MIPPKLAARVFILGPLDLLVCQNAYTLALISMIRREGQDESLEIRMEGSFRT